MREWFSRIRVCPVSRHAQQVHCRSHEAPVGKRERGREAGGLMAQLASLIKATPTPVKTLWDARPRGGSSAGWR